MLVVDRAAARARRQPGGARACWSTSGLSRPAPFQLHGAPPGRRCAQAVRARLAEASWPEAGRDVVLDFDAGAHAHAAHARALHARRARCSRRPPRTAQRAFCVLLLEDVRTRAGAHRGRRSWPRWAASRPASRTRSATRWPPSRRPMRCCWKTRLPPAQQQLTRMVADNVERLKRIVDDVMEVAPGARARAARHRRHGRRWPRSRPNGRAPRGCRWAPSSVLRVDLPAEPLRRGVRRRAPAPRARQPARQRAPPRQRRARARSACAWRRATRPAALLSVASDGAADRARGRAPPVRALLLDAQPRHRAGPVYLPRAVRALRRQHRVPPAPGRRAAAQRVLRQHARAPRRPLPRRRAAPTCRLTRCTDRRLALQPAGRRRRARPAHALRADAAARGLRRRDAPARSRRPGLLLTRARPTAPSSPTCACPTAPAWTCCAGSKRPAAREKAIVITAYGSAENAVEALKAGAYDYLTKPVDLRQFRAVVASALGRAPAGAAPAPRPQPAARARRHAAAPRRAPVAAAAGAGSAWPAQSAAMQQVRALVEQGGAQHGAGAGAAASRAPARNWWRARSTSVSPRGAQPFIAVNCGAIPEHLLEAEFFGYRKGAFTGADEDREGFFQAAQGGTLFLDEIGDLPLAMQSKLLRVIQERAVRPVGAVAEPPVNVRIVSATHKDLGAEVQAGRFRQDLYYRLNVIQIRVPPLRERLEDLPAICDAVLERIARDAGVSPPPRADAPTRCSTCRAMPSRATCANSRTCCTARVALSGGDVDRRAPTWACPKTVLHDGEPLARADRRRGAAAGRAARRRRAPVAAAQRPGGLPRRGRARHPRARAGAPPLQPHRGRRQPGPVAAPDALPHGAAGRGAAATVRPSAASRPERGCAARWQAAGGGRRAPARRRTSGRGRPARRSTWWWCTRSACRRASTAATRSSACSPTGSTGTRIPTSRRSAACEVSAHFLVRRDGAAAAVRVAATQRAWHAGASTWRGRDNCNDFSIGIELEGLEGERFEPAQYRRWRGCCARSRRATRSTRSWATSMWRRDASPTPGRASTGRAAPRAAPSPAGLPMAATGAAWICADRALARRRPAWPAVGATCRVAQRLGTASAAKAR